MNNVYQAQRAQLSNNANIITMGAQVTGIELAKCLVKEYLSVSYDPNSRSAMHMSKMSSGPFLIAMHMSKRSSGPFLIKSLQSCY